MEAYDAGLAHAMVRANEVFERLGSAVEAAAREAPSEPIDVLAISRDAGINVDEKVLERLELPNVIYPLPWLPWYQWWPFQPMWCWWWQQSYPRYRCGPYLLIRRSRLATAA